MIKNFLIINCIGKDDKLGLRINKDFFIENFKNKKNNDYFSVIVNQGPGSFSGIRISLAIAKGLEISKGVKLYGFKNENLKQFNQENIEKLLNGKLIEKKLIKPVYLS